MSLARKLLHGGALAAAMAITGCNERPQNYSQNSSRISPTSIRDTQQHRFYEKTARTNADGIATFTDEQTCEEVNIILEREKSYANSVSPSALRTTHSLGGMKAIPLENISFHQITNVYAEKDEAPFAMILEEDFREDNGRFNIDNVYIPTLERNEQGGKIFFKEVRLPSSIAYVHLSSGKNSTKIGGIKGVNEDFNVINFDENYFFTMPNSSNHADAIPITFATLDFNVKDMSSRKNRVVNGRRIFSLAYGPGEKTGFFTPDKKISWEEFMSREKSLEDLVVDFIDGDGFELFSISDPNGHYATATAIFPNNSDHIIPISLKKEAGKTLTRIVDSSELEILRRLRDDYFGSEQVETEILTAREIHERTSKTAKDFKDVGMFFGADLGFITTVVDGAIDLREMFPDFDPDQKFELTYLPPSSATRVRIAEIKEHKEPEPVITESQRTVPKLGRLENTMIAFTSNRTGNISKPRARLIRPDGQNDVLVEHDNLMDSYVDWDPQTKDLILVSFSPRNRGHLLYSFDLDSKELKLSSTIGLLVKNPDFGFRGNTRAYESDGRLIVLDNKIQKVENLSDPSISPNEKDIAVIKYERGNATLGIYNKNKERFTELNIGELTYPEHPSISPNGKKLAFSASRPGRLFNDRDIFTIDLETQELHQVTNHPYTDSQPSWSPDGTRLVFVSDRFGNRDIFTIGADDENEESLFRLTDSPASDSNPSWSPFLD